MIFDTQDLAVAEMHFNDTGKTRSEPTQTGKLIGD